MRISTKGRYGLRALVDLASHAQEDAVSLVHVAQRQKVSLNYLEQVFATLRKAGIVKSQKGAQGGYMLARRPEEIKVGEILGALEGSFSIVDEVRGKEGQDAIQSAIQELVWDRINRSVNEFLEQSTLAELVEQYKRLQSGEGAMYYI